MNNDPVVRARNLDETVEGQEKKYKGMQQSSHSESRSTKYCFSKEWLTTFTKKDLSEPRFAPLAKACLNIVANRPIHAKFEEIAMANYVQKKLNAVRGPNLVQYQQMQKKAQKLKQEASTLIPPELRRGSPVDMVKEPGWF
jgi:hypothetical protein